MATDWNTYKPTVLKQESGGDYNALYNFAQKPGRIFAGVQPTQMTINDLLNFADPSGPYGQYVKETRPDKQFGVATPLGAYGVVGSTLRDAVKGLGLTGNELFDQATQDKVAEWLYNKRGTSPWTASNKKPVGDIMAMLPNQQPARQPGLLSEFGLQKRDPNATGQTAQPFYQRNNFKDFMGNLAIGLNSMRLSPDENVASAVQNSQKRRTQAQNASKTMAYFASQPGGQAYAQMVNAGASPEFALKAFIDAQTLASGAGTRVQSSTMLPGGLVQTVMADGSVMVKTPDNRVLKGQEAVDAISAAEALNVQQQREIYSARESGKLSTQAELGGAAAAAGETGKQGVQIGKEYFDKYKAVKSSVDNIDRAIAALDAGANSGIIANAFPNLTAASGELRSAMNSLGLDVVAGTTFGALSASELQLALETAVPSNLGPVELRNWLVARRSAQDKAAQELSNAASYFSSGGTIADWLRNNTGVTGATGGGPGSGVTIIANDAEFDALPSGTRFIGPDGIERTKP